MPGLYGAGIWTQDFREKPCLKKQQNATASFTLNGVNGERFLSEPGTETSILAIKHPRHHRYPDSLHNEMKQRREGRGVKRKQQATVATGSSSAGIKTQTH